MEPDRPLNLIESYDLDDPSLDREQIECESPVMFSSYSHSEDSIENWEAGTAEFHSGSDHQPNATTRPVLGAGPRELDLRGYQDERVDSRLESREWRGSSEDFRDRATTPVVEPHKRRLGAGHDHHREATVNALQQLPDDAELAWAKRWTYVATQPAPFARIWAGLRGIGGPEDLRVLRPGLFGLPPALHTEHDGPVLRLTRDCDLLSSVIEEVYKDSQSSSERSRCQGGIFLIAGTGSIATAFKPTDRHPGAGPSPVLEAVDRMGGTKSRAQPPISGARKMATLQVAAVGSLICEHRRRRLSAPVCWAQCGRTSRSTGWPIS
ncbi:hypothetical protein PCASD_03677 [Puccinia coronata f. sp. avenae]|uniref:Uncharacterized protein n=1 Tax=Puccinia coronata f. sp. avenae TaxID=200324 RepID=A0A2N5V9N6_9BASI|nr:hypothetical protein PCASD_03677 [Puccinia coronata f. sp. avenae]